MPFLVKSPPTSATHNTPWLGETAENATLTLSAAKLGRAEAMTSRTLNPRTGNFLMRDRDLGQNIMGVGFYVRRADSRNLPQLRSVGPAAFRYVNDRSQISTDLKDFLPCFLVFRKLSHIVDGQHVRCGRSDFFQGFHFGMSWSFAGLSVSFLSFFTDGPANP